MYCTILRKIINIHSFNILPSKTKIDRSDIFSWCPVNKWFSQNSLRLATSNKLFTIFPVFNILVNSAASIVFVRAKKNNQSTDHARVVQYGHQQYSYIQMKHTADAANTTITMQRAMGSKSRSANAHVPQNTKQTMPTM